MPSSSLRDSPREGAMPPEATRLGLLPWDLISSVLSVSCLICKCAGSLIPLSFDFFNSLEPNFPGTTDSLFVRARLIFLGAPASLKFYVSFNEKDRTQFRARGKLETSTQGKSKGKKIRALIRFRDRRVKARRASCVAENVLKYEGTWLLSGTNATFWCRSYTSLAATPPSWP